MKDKEARESIQDIERQIRLIEQYDLRIEKKHILVKERFGEYVPANYVNLKDVVLALLDHLKLEVDYEEPGRGKIVLVDADTEESK